MMINTTTTTSQDAVWSRAYAVETVLGDARKPVGHGYREVSRAGMSDTTGSTQLPNLPIVVDAFPGVRGWSPPV